jgi:hypothetical protein
VKSKQLIILLENYSPEYPAQGIIQIVFIGTMVSMFLAGSNILYDNIPWSDHIAGYLLVGFSVALFEWGSDRLWGATIAVMIRAPFSLLGYCSRFPFWFFVGAMGYVLALLVAKKMNLLTVYDIPIKPYLVIGGTVGISAQIIFYIILHRIIRNRPYDASRTA